VIVDEASQVDISGLLATYLGKKVVIVGDDEQVSPDAVGTDSGIAQRLQQQYLKIFLTRIYTMAKPRFMI
jgi:superfamily I DNA and/or RNA helicase